MSRRLEKENLLSDKNFTGEKSVHGFNLNLINFTTMLLIIVYWIDTEQVSPIT